MMATLSWTVWSATTPRRTPGWRWRAWCQGGAAWVWPSPWSRARKTCRSVRSPTERMVLVHLPISLTTPVSGLSTISSTAGPSAKAHEALSPKHLCRRAPEMSWLETEVSWNTTRCLRILEITLAINEKKKESVTLYFERAVLILLSKATERIHIGLSKSGPRSSSPALTELKFGEVVYSKLRSDPIYKIRAVY